MRGIALHLWSYLVGPVRPNQIFIKGILMVQTVKIPDIGGASGAVIEILVKKGDVIAADSPLVTVELEKASMDIPSPLAGTVAEILVKVGDNVAEGADIISITTTSDTASAASVPEVKAASVTPLPTQPSAPAATVALPATVAADFSNEEEIYAGPAARRLAHTLGVSLAAIQGSARNFRISRDDVANFSKGGSATASNTFPQSGIFGYNTNSADFNKYGEVTVKPLNKIKRLTGQNLHKSWVNIPHVTHFDVADVTDLEAFRKDNLHSEAYKEVKLTMLAFVCKVVVKALQAFPQFNSSLDSAMENLIYKNYFNIGIAVETPNGLVVPVIRSVDTLAVYEIAREMSRLSTKARDKGLLPNDMSGGSFTVSSLGGIGGNAFTPIINSPEVAILGLSKLDMRPVYQNGNFVPRLMLPLSLSYDHRVIDGAEAARFVRFISEGLSDIRKILL
jgi:pyruvate dehydrogenase E2 component (dihydrolipoamide acetyltransferase)